MIWLQFALLFLTLLIAAEAATRLLFRRSKHHVWCPHTRLDLHIDRQALPDMNAVVRIRINSRGERSSEPPPDSVKCCTVLVAGGSVPECYYLDQDQQWSALLQAALNQPAALRQLRSDAVHVGNIGRSYTCSATLDHILAHILPERTAPNIAVLMVGGNDIAFWLMEGAPRERPAFGDPDDRMFGQHPRQRFGLAPKRTALAEAVRRWLRRKSHTAHAVRNAGARLTRVRLQRAAALRLLTTLPDTTGLVQRFERNLRLSVMRCKSRGVRVIVGIQPCCDKPQWSPEELAAFWGYCDGDPESPLVRIFYDIHLIAELFRLLGQTCARVAKELDVECVDMAPVLAPDLKHYYDFAHVTPLGAEVIAKRLAQQVLQGRA